jgi:hypothetical protein
MDRLRAVAEEEKHDEHRITPKRLDADIQFIWTTAGVKQSN